MVNIQKFLSDNKSLIIAPAGYGKTHTIVDCLQAYSGNKKVLILTHTHAGIGSLKTKIQKANIPSYKYELDTISSHALELAETYHLNKDDFPPEDSLGELLEYALAVAEKLYCARPIIDVLKSRYDHLSIDEYQDCTMAQHKMIMRMSQSVPTHILGDPMQGIFSFRKSVLVDIDNDEDLSPFRDSTQCLDVPWRWKNAGELKLGMDLDAIRYSLISGEDINLMAYDNIECVIAAPDDYYKYGSKYSQVIYRESKSSSLLLIHPNSTAKSVREKYVSCFGFISMIESIDDQDYYSFCQECDKRFADDLINHILAFARNVFKKSTVDNWFNEHNNLKNKRKESDRVISDYLGQLLQELKSNKTYVGIAKIIEAIFRLPDNKTTRSIFVKDIISVLNEAYRFNNSALEALKRNRDKCRRVGRKTEGRCIGTTLLTKGMEYDTVVVLNAHEFKNPKHLYVALTRCCKKLVVVSADAILSPYSKAR